LFSFFVTMLANLKLGRTYDGLIYLGDAARNPPFIRSHRHSELELNLVLQGSITYVIADRRYTFTRGSLLWIFPAQEHQMIDRSADARYYVAVFKRRLIENACRGPLYAELKSDSVDGDTALSKVVRPENFEVLRRLMDTLMDDAGDPDLLNREVGFGYESNFRYEHSDPDALNSGLRYLLVLSWRYFKAAPEAGVATQLHPGVQKALQLLSDGAREESLGRLASRCGVSSAYLSRIFHRQIGVPLNRYRNSTRLTRFMDIYMQPERRTILEAVYAADFGSYAQFYKVFVQSYGHGPGRYFRGIPDSRPPKKAGLRAAASKATKKDNIWSHREKTAGALRGIVGVPSIRTAP
jgi:AraC-like DNA-binding protein